MIISVVLKGQLRVVNTVSEKGKIWVVIGVI